METKLQKIEQLFFSKDSLLHGTALSFRVNNEMLSQNENRFVIIFWSTWNSNYTTSINGQWHSTWSNQFYSIQIDYLRPIQNKWPSHSQCRVNLTSEWPSHPHDVHTRRTHKCTVLAGRCANSMWRRCLGCRLISDDIPLGHHHWSMTPVTVWAAMITALRN